MRNLLLPEICTRQLLNMPRRSVNRKEEGKLIARTSGAISVINGSNYRVRSKFGYNTYRHCNQIWMGLFISRLCSACQSIHEYVQNHSQIWRMHIVLVVLISTLILLKYTVNNVSLTACPYNLTFDLFF